MKKLQDINIIVKNEFFQESDIKLFFDDEEVIFIDEKTDMFDILVKMEVFKSKSDARKNWKRTGREIPKGFNEFKKIGKQRKILTILNPSL